MAKFLKVIVNVILLCSILTAVALLVPPIMGVTTLIVDSPEKSTNLDLGTVTYAKEKPLAEVKVGDRILDESPAGSYVYNVESIDKESSTYKLKDKSSQEEKSEVLRNTALKVIITVPVIGYTVMAMQSMEGLIIIGLIVVFVIILFVLSELWKKSDDEDEYDEGDFEEDTLEEDVVLSRKERKALAKEEKANEKLTKKKEKEYKKAVKKADKYGGAVEDYLEEDIPLLPPKNEYEQSTMTQHSVDAILEATTGEIAKGIGAVTGQIPVIDESVINEVINAEQVVDTVENNEVVKEQAKEMPIVMPKLSADDLIHKALAEGDHPEIVEDKENDLTLLDYSDIL